MPLPILALLLALFCLPCAAWAQVFQAGFRTLGSWTEDPPMRLDVSLWYPATRQPKDLQYPPWTINAALNAKPAEGRFPVLILSHATPADRFAHHTLASLLAREGFIVAAPTHGKDWMDNMDDMFTWPQLAQRAADINTAINLILKEKDLAPCADGNRIGVIGFGSGATAALLLGGALPTAAGWPDYCPRASRQDVYCRPWAKDKMNSLCASFPLTASLANPKVRAIAAIAPGFGMLFNANSFKYFYPPLLLVCAGRDQFNQARLHCEPLARELGSKARLLELPLADENAFMAECPPALAEELPELCQSVSGQERADIHQKLADALLAFFGHYFGIVGNVPIIPPPPDLSPPKEPKEEPRSEPMPQRGRS